MNLLLTIIALITLASAVAAICLRNLVHCVLCLTLSFAGIALTYLELSAEFVGFAQVMVYIGAVTILVLFALLMTRGGKELHLRSWNPGHWLTGLGAGLGTLGVLLVGIFHSKLREVTPLDTKDESVHALGNSLLDTYVLPMEALAVLLTVALIGAALLAMPERSRPGQTFRKVSSTKEGPVKD